MAMRFMLAVIFFGLSFVEANILIESRDEQFANSAQTLLRVRVFNDSKDTLQNVELRYFLSCKERPVILDKHHPQNLSAEIVMAGSECPFLKISIPLLLPGMYPDSGGVALGMWGGTIFAPNADLILGQSSKKLYGRFLGKNITVHQYATVRHVKFEPENAFELVRREK